MQEGFLMMELNEKKELLTILKVMWRKGDSPLRRIYPSWEELVANLEINIGEAKRKPVFLFRSCPYCGLTQKITKPLDELFPYVTCHSCTRPFRINNDLTVRELTDIEEEEMPAEWVRVLEDLNKKKMAIVFKLE
jgi:hypothetical protein